MIELKDDDPDEFCIDFDNAEPVSLLPQEIGKVPICCHRCKSGNLEPQTSQGKLFETFTDLERHNADYHGFDCLVNAKEYQEFHPSQRSKEQWHFHKCVNCSKLCLTDKSYELHIKLEHNPEKANEAKKYHQMIAQTNKDKIDMKIQRQQLVEAILQIREEEKKEKDSKKINSWKTEGDPEAYDVDKVIEELNEVSLQIVKIKNFIS